MKRQRPIAVSGLGAVCAAGGSLPECMETLFGRAPVPAPPSACPGAQHPVFEVPERFLPAADAGGRVRVVRLALAAAHQALADAGLEAPALRRRRVGVVMGTNVAGGVSNRELRKEGAGPLNRPPSASERFLAVNPAEAIARHFGFCGPCLTVVNACAAGSDAIGIAGSWIRSGRCDAVLAGGADAFYEVTYYGFIALMNSDPEPCKPFDARRNGLNLGEGAGLMLLESETLLADRGRPPRAYLAGYGTAGDAHHFTAPDPVAGGLRLAVQDALDSAGIGPAAIAFINAHGTGTRDNDRIESHLFHDLFPGVPFGSTKGATGHTLGAAGALEAAFTIACLERGRIPASAGFAVADPELPAHPVRGPTAVRGAAALSQTLAFGGNNSVLIFSRGDGS
jgi:3-oxoacyl-[acyl-carrier-protein] synthase-1/3-oxoacyl-[acyl-carrier-protein] synthase II